ncbi:solute carrier family 23 member 1-like [Ylistrum balloti]|uniref:solute carrier family 23 member 1-like n=1 Tax=Ylistrum balloti TaxID=509963 RepID=UPI002905A8C5|nr:solute carrier family 23 member 1-like [Ylistrum balloti]
MSDASETISCPSKYNDVLGQVAMSNTGSQYLTEDEDGDNTTTEDSLQTDSNNSLVKQLPPLVYKISDNPPLHLTIIFAFQQGLLSFANQLALTLLVSQVVCGEHDAILRTNLLGSTMFMNGFTTFFMCCFGVRLPMFQGGSYEYIVPLVALQEINPGRCKAAFTTGPTNNNSVHYFDFDTDNTSFHLNSSQVLSSMKIGTTQHVSQEFIYHNLQTLMLYLHFISIHSLIGATGLVGTLLRFIGPVTIVPAILLVGLYMFKTVTKFVSVHWGMGLMTCAVSLILSLYLGQWKVPLPFWTRSKGFHIIRSQFHQTAAILIALLFGWAVSAILTVCGVFSNDPKATDYFARTDVMSGVIQNASWIYFPYPGQFGPPSFSGSAFIGFLIATLISILDSIGDYYACARTCRVPTPPTHAVNRGIAVEGFCSFLSGTVGCGHATSTYGGNIGIIGLTKVASRRVFMVVGILYMLFGTLGKFCAFFIMIPYPVLGGTVLTMIGMFTGVVLSNLQHVSLTSNRNLAIIGISLILGLMVPYWVEKNSSGIDTGNASLDQLLIMLMGNANLTGAVTACLLDNTVPGTREERGLAAWEHKAMKGDDPHTKTNEEMGYLEGLDVYDPLVPKFLRGWKGFKYIPFMPDHLCENKSPNDTTEMNGDCTACSNC